MLYIPLVRLNFSAQYILDKEVGTLNNMKSFKKIKENCKSNNLKLIWCKKYWMLNNVFA